MKYKIIWSKDAGEEFIEIISWYKYTVGKNVAEKISSKINSQIKKLKDIPGIGKQIQILKDIGINKTGNPPALPGDPQSLTFPGV